MDAKQILFTEDMNEAAREGRKIMTRRVIKPQPEFEFGYEAPHEHELGIFWKTDESYESIDDFLKEAPYQPGDILYVRETWKCTKYNSMDGDLGYEVEFMDGSRKYFEFDDNERFHEFGKYAFKNGWQPSIFMPKEAARTFLVVTNIRVERLQEITEEDAIKEGFQSAHYCDGDGKFEDVSEYEWTAVDEFRMLWIDLYAKRGYGWNENPWVWVYEFKRVEVQL